MNNLKTTIILPLIALGNLILENIFHITLPEGTQETLTTTIVNTVSLIAVGYGIWKNHHVPRSDEIKAQVVDSDATKQVVQELAKDPAIVPPTGSQEALKAEDLTINVPSGTEATTIVKTTTGSNVEKDKPNG